MYTLIGREREGGRGGREREREGGEGEREREGSKEGKVTLSPLVSSICVSYYLYNNINMFTIGHNYHKHC